MDKMKQPACSSTLSARVCRRAWKNNAAWRITQYFRENDKKTHKENLKIQAIQAHLLDLQISRGQKGWGFRMLLHLSSRLNTHIHFITVINSASLISHETAEMDKWDALWHEDRRCQMRDRAQWRAVGDSVPEVSYKSNIRK